MDHGAMNHGDMDHSAMNHDHGSMGHSAMNHGAMDQAAMDHGAMDHAAMNHGSLESSLTTHSMMMAMTFHGGCEETILFDFWRISTVGGLVGSCIGIFLLGVLYEGIKFYREFLMARGFSPYNNLQVNVENIQRRGSDENSITSIPTTPPRRNSAVKVIKTNMLSQTHFVQTILHMVQFTLSYFLMLIAMTFNSWLFGAVVAGATAGYFLFGWKKTVMMEAEGGCH